MAAVQGTAGESKEAISLVPLSYYSYYYTIITILRINIVVSNIKSSNAGCKVLRGEAQLFQVGQARARQLGTFGTATAEACSSNSRSSRVIHTTKTDYTSHIDKVNGYLVAENSWPLLLILLIL